MPRVEDQAGVEQLLEVDLARALREPRPAVPARSSAVVISADLVSAGDQPGRSAATRAARPATCGALIDVPE